MIEIEFRLDTDEFSVAERKKKKIEILEAWTIRKKHEWNLFEPVNHSNGFIQIKKKNENYYHISLGIFFCSYTECQFISGTTLI